MNSTDSLREAAFVIAETVGALVFALGVTFFALGVTINTQPPAPYVPPDEKRVLLAVSVIITAIGLGAMRLGGRFVNW